MNWIAYCTTCGKVLENCPNGHFVEGAARVHIKNPEHTYEHQVIVGYLYNVEKEKA